MKGNRVADQIDTGARQGGKHYTYNEDHDETLPAQMWFQESDEGRILFVVFYTQACRWSRCLGCNLPSQVSREHVSYRAIMAQVDHIFGLPEVKDDPRAIRKVIMSNNGSILDEATFSSTALMYFVAKLNLHLPNLSVLCVETRPEYVDLAELEFISRALVEGETATALEIAVGFEAFDDQIRNEIFNKGLPLATFQKFVEKVAPYGYRLKCYFMQKPVPGMTDAEAVVDVRNAIEYLHGIALHYDLVINVHLNPTYAATGTPLEEAFRRGDFTPPRLEDVIKAVRYAENTPLSVFVGLSDEGLSTAGGSFIREGDAGLVEKLEKFNRSQNYELLA